MFHKLEKTMTKEAKNIFEKMPDRFTREDFIREAKKLNKVFSYYGYLLSEAVSLGMIKAQGNGNYVKVKNAI